MSASPRLQVNAALPARELIARHGGRVTQIRVALVEVLFAARQALTHDEIAAALTADGIAHDRVTLYRALDWLSEQGLARRVPGSDRSGRFEAVREGSHRHAHFHCERCGQMFCLESLAPALTTVTDALPDGFRLERAELILHGACPDCSMKAS